MFKAKELIQTLCTDLNYRFFSGVYYEKFHQLYKYLDSTELKYIRSIDERTGLGLSFGSAISGMGSVFILDLKFSSLIYPYLPFIIQAKLPFFILGCGSSDEWSFAGLPKMVLKDSDSIIMLSKTMDMKKTPGVLIVEEGVLK